MKIVIINGSARKGNTLTAINAFIKGASEKNEIGIPGIDARAPERTDTRSGFSTEPNLLFINASV